MATQRFYLTRLAIQTTRRELTYNSNAAWDNAFATLFSDFDEASAHVDWDDTILTNNELVTGQEMMTKQELVRQSARLPYTEPFTKPHTLASMFGLTLGNIVTAADSVANAFRHRIEPRAAVDLYSTRFVAQQEGGSVWQYTGMKGNDYTFSRNDAAWQLQQNLVGSGARATISLPTFPAAIAEDWLRFGDTRIYLRNTGGTPQNIPGTPTQTANNLGSGVVEISERVTDFSHAWNNQLAVENAYRAGTGLLRRNPHGQRRTGTVSFGMEMDTATEANDFAYYTAQSRMSLEINCNSGVLLTAGGTFRFGFILIIPRLQFSRKGAGEQDALELINFEANILNDGTNAPVIWWIYNKQPGYYTAGV